MLFAAYQAVAQEQTKIDHRLLANDEIRAKSIDCFTNDPEAYKFLIYELENAWFVKPISSLTEAQGKQLLSIEGITDQQGKPFSPSVVDNKEKFNFHEYNFQRHQTKTIAYDLGNGNALIFYSLEKLRIMFNQNSTNQTK